MPQKLNVNNTIPRKYRGILLNLHAAGCGYYNYNAVFKRMPGFNKRKAAQFDNLWFSRIGPNGLAMSLKYRDVKKAEEFCQKLYEAVI